jgi:TolB-like protein
MTRLATRLLATVFLGLTPSLGLVTIGAAQAAPTVAVLPFEDGGSHGRPDEEFAGLRRGIAAVLASELARNASVRVADRHQIARLLAADGLGDAARLDAATTARIAKSAGAGLAVAGTFIDLYGDVRLDARLVDVGTGNVSKVVRSDPKLTDRRQLFRIIQSVAERVVEAGGLGTITPANREAARARNLSTEALTDFGRGLLHLDRGETAKAEEFLAKAAAAPDFPEARDALRSLRERG